MYYLCSENKGADQFRSYCEADLRLCFRLCRLFVFLCSGSIIFDNIFALRRNRDFSANVKYLYTLWGFFFPTWTTKTGTRVSLGYRCWPRWLNRGSLFVKPLPEMCRFFFFDTVSGSTLSVLGWAAWV